MDTTIGVILYVSVVREIFDLELRWCTRTITRSEATLSVRGR